MSVFSVPQVAFRRGYNCTLKGISSGYSCSVYRFRITNIIQSLTITKLWKISIKRVGVLPLQSEKVLLSELRSSLGVCSGLR